MPLNFTAVDFETGNGEICSIGAVKVRNGNIIAEYAQLVNTDNGEYTTPQEMRKNGGITASDVANQPIFPQVFPQFVNFIEDDLLVAHSASSADMNLLKKAFIRYRILPINNEWFCTQWFYDNAYPEHKTMKYKWQQQRDLKNAYRVLFGEKIQNHHVATEDARNEAKIAIKLAQILGIDDLTEADKKAREIHTDCPNDALRGKITISNIDIINFFEKHPEYR